MTGASSAGPARGTARASAHRGQPRRRPYTPRRPSSERRDQLLDAALEIIARDGYAAVSIEAIARALDVTRPVVYHVFAGLDDLLYALLDRQEQRALSQLAARISAVPDLRDLPGFVARTVRELVAMITDDPLTWRLIFLPSAGTPVAVRERVDRDREVVRERLRTIVELAIATGGAAPELDADVVSHLLVALGEYFGRLILERPGAIEPELIATTLSAMLAGVRG